MRVAKAMLSVITMLTTGIAVAGESGFQLDIIQDAARNRPIAIDWWYPVEDQAATTFDYGLGQGSVVEAGAIAPGTFPLVVLSHGAFGAARNYSWLAEALARQGYLVAGLSHYGESYVHGAQTVDPTSVLRSWERPLDVSAALNHLLDNARFTQSIDPTRIGFVGHSSGGATALSLAGVLFDGARIAEYCLTAQAAEDRGCDYGRSQAGGVINPSRQPETKNYADARIQALVALDPALGPGFVDYSGVPAQLQMLVIGSVNNDFLPFKHHAQDIVEKLTGPLPNVASHQLAEGEGHFVYLNECSLDIQANGVALCEDRPGVNRADVHNALLGLILPFLDQSFQR